MKPQVFVIGPFADAGWRLVRETVERSAMDLGYETLSVESSRSSAVLTRSNILNSIRQAELVVVDVSRQNPNVMYELGYAHALQKPSILLINKSDSSFPSDLTGFFYIPYDLADLDRLATEVKREIRERAVERSA